MVGPGHDSAMTALLRHRLAVHDIVTIDDATACGLDRHAIRRMTRSGKLHRVHHGAYVAATTWREATPEDRHLLRARAILDRWQHVALSHMTAVIAHGLPVYGATLDVVHLTRLRRGRVGRRGTVQVHPDLGDPAPVVEAGDRRLPTCTIATAVLQVADWSGLEAGMVAAEAALHTGRVTTEALQQARALVRLGRGRANADLVVRLANRYSESPGETLARLLMLALDIPEPEQQVDIELPSGGIARVDFLLRTLGVVVEFDGEIKYAGADGRSALVREKRREDGIRACGYEIVRLIWSDLSQPACVQRLIHAAASRAARQ